MPTPVDLVRQEWAEGHRRLEAARSNPMRYRALEDQAGAVSDELRRRLGTVFDLLELVDEYRSADAWVRGVIAELPPPLRWPAGVTTATDAAFHRYSRGARDYEP